MRIAVIGAGAMGSLFGGLLSRHHEVLLVDTNRERVDAINENGLVVYEADGGHTFCRPHAAVNTKNMIPAALSGRAAGAAFLRRRTRPWSTLCTPWKHCAAKEPENRIGCSRKY